MAKAKSKELATYEREPVSALARMASFTHGVCDEHTDFAFTRYWYKEEENREGIKPWIDRKLFPGDHQRFGAAARFDVLIPPSASGDFARLATLLDRFDETLPPFEQHAMVQAKIFLDEEEAWHVGYERVRSFARAHFAQRFAVILIAHIPGTAGLAGQGNHVHCAVLSRKLNINGFGGACTNLCSDRGYEAALAAWQDHKKKWKVAA